MGSLYAEAETPVDTVTLFDESPHLPLLGFLVGAGVSVSLWMLLAALVWVARS